MLRYMYVACLVVIVIGTDFTEPAGVMNTEPVAVAHRGKPSTKLANPTSTGRGLQITFCLHLLNIEYHLIPSPSLILVGYIVNIVIKQHVGQSWLQF